MKALASFILAALLTAAIAALLIVTADHDDRLDRLEQQGSQSSEPTPTTTTSAGVRVLVGDACVGMSRADAQRIGGKPCR